MSHRFAFALTSFTLAVLGFLLDNPLAGWGLLAAGWVWLAAYWRHEVRR